MRVSISDDLGQKTAMVHPEFEALVQRIIQAVDKEKLSDLRKDFHTRLRITLTQPDNAELIEDLWDFFYDWCLFEEKLPDRISTLDAHQKEVWEHAKVGNQHGLYAVLKIGDNEVKLKELFLGKSYVVKKVAANDFLGINRGDIIEGRLVGIVEGSNNPAFSFVRRPSYHPTVVHDYIKKKVKQFKRSKDFSTYQSWLWLLVGMYLKHRIYNHMPIEKIYDDNSRI